MWSDHKDRHRKWSRISKIGTEGKQKISKAENHEEAKPF